MLAVRLVWVPGERKCRGDLVAAQAALTEEEIDKVFDSLDHPDGTNHAIANKRAPNHGEKHDEEVFIASVEQHAPAIVGRLMKTARRFASK